MHKHMLRALGLALLAALGLMGLTAGGAQAEALAGVPGRILIGGVDAATGTVIEAEQEGQGTYLIPALNAEIVCEKVKVLEGKVIGKGQALVKFLYEKCVLWATKKNAVTGEQELTTKLPCELLEDESPFTAGNIVANLILLVVLHEVSAGVSDTYLLATGDKAGKEEGPFASILFTTPSECPLPKLTELLGSFVFKVTLGDLNLKQPEELYVLATASKALSSSGLFTDKFKFGVNEAFLDASFLFWLSSDKNWGVE